MATLILKKPVQTKKFGLTFPADTELNYFESSGKKFVEHPKHKHTWTEASEKNIKQIID